MVPLIVLLLPLPKISYKTAAIIASICVIVCICISINEVSLYRHQVNDNNYIELLYDRTFGRAQNEMKNDRQESIILEQFSKEGNIIHTLFGWGVAQYTFHVPGQAIGRNLIPVQSGLVLSLVDFGIVGIVLIMWLCYIILKVIKLSLQSKNVYAQAFSIAALSAFIGSLMFGNITTCFIYLMLAIYAYYDEEELSVNRHIV